MEFEVFRTSYWTVHHSSDVAVPGYLIVLSRDSVAQFTALSQPALGELGMLLSRTTNAVEVAVHAERVYVCMFGESNAPPHFHVFPRMSWMLNLANDEAGECSQPVDGAAVFSRVRQRFSDPSDLRNAEAQIRQAIAVIRETLMDSYGLARAR